LHDFEVTYYKVQKYRLGNTETAHEQSQNHSLGGFQIAGFGPIIDTNFVRIPDNTQWIFFTGENGTGKTSLLRAIASGLCYTKIELEHNTSIILLLNDSVYSKSTYLRNDNGDIRKRKPIVSGFCSYGAARLKTSNTHMSKFSFLKSLSKDGLVQSLFDVDTVLIDIDNQLEVWNRNPNLFDISRSRAEYIKEILIEVLPKVHDIKFSFEGDANETLYIEKDDNHDKLKPAVFN
jgi:hypothetical protein